jgi:threonine/homoserine/homoserine lactone efflux protein
MEFLFLKSLLLGIVVSAPVGPVAAMAMSRSLVFGKKLGFLTGLGIALADALFALIAALGVSQVIEFVAKHRPVIGLVGGLILVIMGTHLFASAKKIALRKKAKRVKTSVAIFGSFLIGISNPLAIFTFLAAFADPRLGHLNSKESIFLVTAGVFMGACLWWLFLVLAVTRFRSIIQGRALIWVNRILGLFVLVIGILMIFSRLPGP